MSGRPLVGVVMGSDSDWPVMRAAAEALAEFDVPHEADVVSAHRMPRERDARFRSSCAGHDGAHCLRAHASPSSKRRSASRNSQESPDH